MSNAATPIPFTAPLEPDASQALTFFAALFRDEDGESVHFRAVPEPKDGRVPTNHHYALDQHFSANIDGFLAYCQAESKAAFFLPGVVRGAGTGKADVASLPAVLVDFDKGDPAANLAAAEALVGPATIVIESGGQTEKGPKLHAYWRLETSANGSAIGDACRVREALALKFGGDPAFKQAAQVIRVPGSIHFKGTPTLVKLRTVRPEAAYELGALVSAICATTPKSAKGDNIFDFSAVEVRPSGVDRALTAPVHAEGVDDVTRFQAAGQVIGHFIRMVREGRYTEEEAWCATKDWNIATLVPPWPVERLRGDFDRIMREDISNRGPLPTARPSAADWARFEEWRGDGIKFAGVPPPRKYLIDGVLPLGVPGVVAASGGLGKSYLMLDLALRIATGAPANDMDFSREQLILGGVVREFGTAVLFCAEDDRQTIQERLMALDPTEKWRTPRLRPVPLPDAGGPRPLFAADREGYRTTPEFEATRTWLKTLPDLKLVVFDPLQTLVAADITSKPEAGQFVMSALGTLAVELGATLLVTHHVKKTEKAVRGPEDARAAIRGTTAIVDGVRWVYALWEAEDAKSGERVVAAGAVVKANGKSDTRVHKYERLVGGVLRQLPPTFSPDGRADILDALAEAIKGAAVAGAPFTMTGPNGLFEQRHRLPEVLHKISKSGFATFGQELLEAGRAVKSTARGGGKGRNWLDVPDGDFAMGIGVIMSGSGALAA